MDLAFVILKAEVQLESDGKLQLTWGSSKLDASTSGDWSLPCSLPCPGSLTGPCPSRGVQGRLRA